MIVPDLHWLRFPSSLDQEDLSREVVPQLLMKKTKRQP